MISNFLLRIISTLPEWLLWHADKFTFFFFDISLEKNDGMACTKQNTYKNWHKNMNINFLQKWLYKYYTNIDRGWE